MKRREEEKEGEEKELSPECLAFLCWKQRLTVLNTCSIAPEDQVMTGL